MQLSELPTPQDLVNWCKANDYQLRTGWSENECGCVLAALCRMLNIEEDKWVGRLPSGLGKMLELDLIVSQTIAYTFDSGHPYCLDWTPDTNAAQYAMEVRKLAGI